VYKWESNCSIDQLYLATALNDYKTWVDTLNLTKYEGPVRDRSHLVRDRTAFLESLNSTRTFEKAIKVAARQEALERMTEVLGENREKLQTEAAKQINDLIWDLSSEGMISQYEEEIINLNEKEREQRTKQRQDLLWKIIMALLSGLTLIAPMFIMTLHPTLLTTLLTTSIFTIAIAILLAIVVPKAEAKDIVAATVAYTAVLVVFVGVLVDKTIGDDASDSSSEMTDSSIAHWKVVMIVITVTGGIVMVAIAVLLLWSHVAKRDDVKASKQEADVEIQYNH
jgi:VIT1/CCC1 family predicted Fe2+/Mn2+ transporter